MVSYVVMGAIWGSFNIIWLKSVGELLRASIAGDSQMDEWFLYVSLILFIIANIGLVYWKEKALSIFGALHVVPIYHVSAKFQCFHFDPFLEFCFAFWWCDSWCSIF